MAQQGGSGGIFRYVRLVLDRAAARRMEREAQEALDDGTDPTAAKRNLGEVDSAADRIGTTFKRVGQAIAAAFAIQKIKEFTLHMFRLGSSAAETASQFSVVFGDSAGGMQKFLDGFARMAGLNKTAGQEFAATAGAIAQGMGLTQQASAQMSEQILRLAGDIASFKNLPIEQTFRAVIGGITGEREALKTLGIVLQETEVQTRALAMTGKEHADELTQQEKAAASLALMLEKAGVMVGDLEATQDSAANVAKQLTTDYENMQIALAAKLLPVFEAFQMWVVANREQLMGAADDIIAVVIPVFEWLANLFNSVASVLSGTLAVAIGLVTGMFGGLAKIASVAGAAVAGVLGFLGAKGPADAAQAWANKVGLQADIALAQSGAMISGGVGGMQQALGWGLKLPTAKPAGASTPRTVAGPQGPSAADMARAKREAKEAEKARKKAEAEAKKKAAAEERARKAKDAAEKRAAAKAAREAEKQRRRAEQMAREAERRAMQQSSLADDFGMRMAGGGSFNPGGGIASRADRMGPEIHIYVDGIDPNNPKHQTLTRQTMEYARQRYGTGGTVQFHPRRKG